MALTEEQLKEIRWCLREHANYNLVVLLKTAVEALNEVQEKAEAGTHMYSAEMKGCWAEVQFKRIADAARTALDKIKESN